MSGSTIGGVVGAGIGFFLAPYTGGASIQWGWMIGSIAGGLLMPENYEGPRLGEATRQTAQDGVPLTYIYGTASCAGNLIWVGDVVEHRHKESAKGGPTQTTYTYTVSYAICVCKGPISGYKIIKRNGKIVYDARTDAELTALGYSSQDIAEARAAQAEFLQRATLYYGDAGQMPDPTMVAALGADEVPAYTGIAYIVLKDDETREGEVSQYEFVVAACGERRENVSFVGEILVTGSEKTPGGPVFAKALTTATPEFEGIAQSTGANIDAAIPAYVNGTWLAVRQNGVRYSTDHMATWQSRAISSPNTIGSVVALPAGVVAIRQNWDVYSVYTAASPLSDFTLQNSLASTISTGAPGDARTSNVAFAVGQEFYLGRGKANRAVYRSGSPNGPYSALWDYIREMASGRNPNAASIIAWFDIKPLNGYYYAIVSWDFREAFRRFRVIRSASLTDWSVIEVIVDVDDSDAHLRPAQLAVGPGVICALTPGGYIWTNANGWSEPIATGLTPSNQTEHVAMVGGQRIAFASGHFYCIGYGDTLAVFDPVTLGVDLVELPIRLTTGLAVQNDLGAGLTEIPDSPGFYIDRETGDIVGPSGTQIDPCAPTLGSIVADQCSRRGVSSRDVSELTDTVLGYRVAAPSTPQKNIQGLQPGYFFGASEFDGKLVFAKRGRNLTFALTYDDFVERDGDPIQWERTQERDFARKVTVAYVDPETSYAPTTQQAERRAATIAAEGENTVELPVTGTKDWAAQVADKSLKVAYGEPDECTFHVSIAHAELVTGAEGTVPYTDGEPTVVRIERIEDEGLVRMVTARKTRKSLYESNASGASKPLPKFPGSNIRGPTDGLLLNIPVLIDQDDRPGIHWAASGMLSGWQGGQLQIRRAGQWVVAGNVSASAGLGRLVNALPAHAGDVDTANVLRVQFNEALASVSWVNLLQERNPLAILRDDGTAEIVQFQTATEVSPNVFDLTTLLRGRLATVPDDHAAGARVVFLDDRVQYATLEATDLGTTLEYRFVSNGTDPDAAPIQTIELTTMESQREWPVADLSVEVDGDDYTVAWLRRDRLGTDVLPIRSAHWAGYEVAYSWSGGTGSVVVTTETHTFTLPGASDITFSVSQLNQYTGAGPAQTVTIP